jgi:type VI secretion system protein ImpK
VVALDRVNDVTRDSFNAILQLRQLEETAFPDPALLHQRLCSYVDALFQRAAQAGFTREDIDDIAYAVVALADEVVLSKSDAIREYWIPNLLQLRYFKENVAGEAFFTRLETIRRNPRRVEVLRVYSLALAFGFQGRYRVRGGELELLTLAESLQRELAGGRRYESEVLSPSGDRPDEAVARGSRSGPMLGISLAAMGLAVLLYFGLRVNVAAGAASAIEQIESARPPP